MYWTALGFCFGTILGSFVKAVSERLIKDKSILGRSYCLECKHQLKWYDLFPIFSYILLQGKCRYCHHKIPFETFWIEVVSGILFGLLFLVSLPYLQVSLLTFNGQSILFFSNLLFKTFVLVVLLIVFLTDLETGFIYDKVTLSASLISLLYVLSIGIIKTVFLYQSVQRSFIQSLTNLSNPHLVYLTQGLQTIGIDSLQTILAGILAGGLFLLLALITRGKGMGGGDVKFVFFLGLALGFPGILIALFLSFLIGSIFSLGLIALGKKTFGQTIPFGPFLAIGAYITLLWGAQILNFYLHFQ